MRRPRREGGENLREVRTVPFRGHAGEAAREVGEGAASEDGGLREGRGMRGEAALRIGQQAGDAEGKNAVPIGGGMAEVGACVEESVVPGGRVAVEVIREVAAGDGLGALGGNAGKGVPGGDAGGAGRGRGIAAANHVMALDDTGEDVGGVDGETDMGQGVGEHFGARHRKGGAGGLALFVDAAHAGVDFLVRKAVREDGVVEGRVELGAECVGDRFHT